MAGNKNIPFKELEKFFEDFVPPDGEIQLSPGEKIINQKGFIQNHIDVLKANSGNRRVMTFYDRLLKYYNLVNKK